VSCSFSIDDGTGTAFVSCSGSQVAQLLTLTEIQWSELEDLVRPLGHIAYELVCRKSPKTVLL